MKNKKASIGNKIYSLRMAKEMTQEQLASWLCVSPAAVSKWERNLANPDIELLWQMADFFGCSIDELVGRKTIQLDQVGAYEEEKLRLTQIANDLLKCSEISRAKGLLAMESEIPRFKGGSRFLAFAIPYILSLFMRQVEMEQSFRLLENYAAFLPETERTEGRMVVDALKMIFAGERPEIIQELIASYIGVDYREKVRKMDAVLKQSREEILNKYSSKKPYSEATNLLEIFRNCDDFEIQTVLRGTDSDTLAAALYGASGETAVCFLSNLSDRVLYFISEDIEHWSGAEEDILAAQRKILGLLPH